MDLDFFNMLKSIAAAEKASDFSLDSYDASTLELKYPRNVITVASPTGKAPPPKPGETRVSKLSEAVYTARLRAENGRNINFDESDPLWNGCSIVIHEGIYIDALDSYSLGDIKLEIVGVKNVRLVLDKDIDICVCTSILDMRNILIFDRRLNPRHATINIIEKSWVEFFRVNIHGPGATALHIVGGSCLSLHSSIVKCSGAIKSEDSEVYVKDCTIKSSPTATHVGDLIHLRRSGFEATNTSFSHRANTCIYIERTRATMNDCKLNGAFTFTDAAASRGLGICSGSFVSLSKTSISNFTDATYSTGCDCKIFAENCVISDCEIAFAFHFNSHGFVKDCRLRCLIVAHLSNNVKGKIEFQDTQMDGGTRALFFKDTKSNLPHHNFDSFTTETRDNFLLEGPTAKEQSVNTERWYAAMAAAKARGDAFDGPGCVSGKWKFCNKCRRNQMPADEKMKFCVKCKKVCYCSKECQKADWGDHKLACRSWKP